MITLMGSIGLVWLVSVAGAQQSRFVFSEFSVSTDSLPVNKTFVIQDTKYGTEFWAINVYAKHVTYEGISPQLKYQRRGVSASVGAYARWNDDHMVRSGVAGFLSLGDAKGWRLDGPFYLFQTDPDHKTGMWLPNSRVTHPVGRDCRLGLGLGDTNIQETSRSTSVGIYLGIQTKEWSLQARPGFVVSPGAQRGKRSLFVGLGYKF